MTGPLPTTNLSNRYFLACEGSLRTTMSTFVAGQMLSFADNTFVLPCAYAVHPQGVADPAKASRIGAGVGYRM